MPSLSPASEADPAVFSQARWIWPDCPFWDLHNGYALFRHEFHLDSVPGRAPLHLTADQSYQLYLNGRFIGRGPARGFQSNWPFDTHEVASFLMKGRNVIAVRAYNPGHSNFQYITQGYAGLLLAAHWGKSKILSCHGTWKSLRQPGIRRDAAPCSMQLFPQEHADLRHTPLGWQEPDFDDSHWSKPSDLVWNALPWYSLEARGIPNLVEKEVTPTALLGRAEGDCAPGCREARDIAHLRTRESLAHSAVSGESLSPVTISPTAPGKFQSLLLDFGKTHVGNLEVELEGAGDGTLVDFIYVESLDATTLSPHLLERSSCFLAFASRLICREGKNAHRFYHAQGFRYLIVTVRDAPKPLTLSIRLHTIGYPMPRNGAFQSSEAILEKIWETCAWTQQCCSLDAYVDTPWREQAQWWGDARVQAWNTFHLSGDARLFRRGIKQIAQQTTADGVTYGHAPTMAHGCVLPDFTLIWMLTLWDHYWQTGSLEAFQAHQSTIEKALVYFQKNTDPKLGLVGYDPRFWLFLDWTGLFKDGYSTVYNLWLLLALERLAEMYRLNRQPKQVASCTQWAKKLRAALQPLLDRKGLLRDGFTFQRKIVPSTSVHAQTLAIMAGLRPASETRMIEECLLPAVRGTLDSPVQPSSYWITYLFSVLSERGYAADVVADIEKRWTPMVTHGTTWELFQPTSGDQSRSHAWSAHPLFHLIQTIGGIRQSSAGWKSIRFAPEFIGEQGGSTVPTPQGKIVSRWEKKKDHTAVSLRLPSGVSAEVHLPGLKPTKIRQSATWKL